MGETSVQDGKVSPICPEGASQARTGTASVSMHGRGTFPAARGTVCHQRVPYGISIAISISQSKMDPVLHGFSNVSCLIDDILIATEMEEEHLTALGSVLSRLEEHGLVVSEAKCLFCVPDVIYLGHYIDGEGIHYTKQNVEAIFNMK